jgi:biopolymer transport protein ExbD
MSRRSFLKRPVRSTDMSLQITSMADIFIIVLIFILKSYSLGAFEVAPPRGIQLPTASSSGIDMKPGQPVLKVEVSESSVSIDGRRLARISGYAFPSSDIGDQGVSKSMSSALEVSRGEGRILVVADQRAPYETIRTVLATAALRGYTDVKLAVTRYE